MDNNYTQLCCWSGTNIDGLTNEEFEKDMLEIFGVRIKMAETVITLPDETGPGGRSDLLFYVHTGDINKFTIPRLKAGIRWWEDVIKYNDNSHLYTTEILENINQLGNANKIIHR